MKLHLLFAAAFTALFLAGCATPVQHKTASGKPETTINNVTTKQVKSKLTSDTINMGYTATKSDDNSISFDKPVNNALAGALLGSRYDSTPNARLTYMLMQVNKSVRVVADMQIVTNPGSAFEQKTDMNGSNDSIMIQNRLNILKWEMEPKK